VISVIDGIVAGYERSLEMHPRVPGGIDDPGRGHQLEHEVTQTMWLEPAAGTPFEPALVVETRRGIALGGRESVTRTVYRRGYR
jgi:hypothetical protein